MQVHDLVFVINFKFSSRRADRQYICIIFDLIQRDILQRGEAVRRPASLAAGVGCMAIIGAALALVWLNYFRRYAPFPQKDPRMMEALGLHHPQASEFAVAKYEGTR